MTLDNRWLLPDGIDELLPERAEAVEALRRQMLDSCAGWGYRYVIPPLVEFTDSLLVGLGADLDVLTCKFSDRLSGRTLGVRADMTPQVARIDAHSLGENGVTRLCYAGSTLHSAPQSVMAGRSPIQIGAELFGCADISADIEVISLMLTLLGGLGVAKRHLPITLDIGHVGLYEALLASTDLDDEAIAELFDALQRKSLPDLEAVLSATDASAAQPFRDLLDLHGDIETLDRAQAALGHIEGVNAAIDSVRRVLAVVADQFPEVAIYVDLAELRGFRYHTGLVFAAYLEGVGTAVAKGGRYDNVGDVFGRKRAATGFACDLKAVAAATGLKVDGAGAIAAPTEADAELQAKINSLRAEGQVVISMVAGSVDARCTQLLQHDGTAWQLVPVEGVES